MISRNRPSIPLGTLAVGSLVVGWAFLRLWLVRESLMPLTFVVPMMVCVWTQRRWHLWLMAIAFAILGFVKAYWLIPEMTFTTQARHMYFGGTLFNIAAGALVIHLIMSLRDRLEARNAVVEQQNSELQTQTEELSQQNEEIRSQAEELAQQTEEIESQAEELQRQNEDLHETNARLAGREELLQAILQSTRAPSQRRKLLDDVCKRALSVLGAPADALLILEQDESKASLHIRAVARHETLPPMPHTWPMAQSLAQVVLKENRTAYVDDLNARPDLAAPFAQDGAVRSMLATPLCVDGEAAGVVMAVSRDVNHWSNDQFRLIEWVAAQCCLIIEGLNWQNALEKRTAEVEAANKAKDHFLAMLSHELRTPLTPVLAAASSMEQDKSLPESVRNNLGVIRRNVAVQSRLIDDLLDLTRLSRGKLELHQQRVAVQTLLDETAAVVASDLAARQQTLNVQSTLPDDAEFEGDGPRIQQVIWNLLKNAIKFSPQHATIYLRADLADEGRARISVADSGIGIDTSDHEVIFRPFEQTLDARRRTGNQGLGLGLCIAKAIVEMHGGTIGVKSDGLGRGATFTVELPLFAGAEETPRIIDAKGNELKASANPLKVLVVEDHADTAELFVQILDGQGFAVSHAGDVASSVEHARNSRFDMVVSDVGLPDGTGMDVIRKLKEIQPELRGICLSGFGMEADLRASSDAGFDEHLVKPVDAADLIAAVSRVAAKLAITIK